MDARSAALLALGIGLMVALVVFLIAIGAFSWFGRLPGDIRIETDNARVFIPITSMILVSVALSLVAYAIRRLL
jgi:uncharacterized protein HemY